jgi:predicted transposase YbfD/YdcC
VFQIRRESLAVKTEKLSNQTIYGITSLSVEEYGAEELLSLTRKHWGIENGLHYRRDVTFVYTIGEMSPLRKMRCGKQQTMVGEFSPS